MLFASDLDRTLIYSRNIEGFDKAKKEDIRLVEILDGREISYMSCRAIELLQIIQERLLFVPVTTRTIEQYTRISFFSKEINPKYAITTNGGNILINNQIDDDWRNIIQGRLNNDCESLDIVKKEFETSLYSDTWVNKVRKADDMFFYCVIDNSSIPMEELKEYEEWLKSKKWRISLNGRKLYFIPNCISKKNAVEYVAEREELDQVVTGGDSILDFEMMNVSNEFICPQHGELFTLNLVNKESILFTKKRGMSASEEILDYVIQLHKNQMSKIG